MSLTCPKCGGPTCWLGGASAHPNNLYCEDDKGCGWQAWGVQSVRTKPDMTLATFVKARGYRTCIEAAAACGISVRTLAYWYGDPVKSTELLIPRLELAQR